MRGAALVAERRSLAIAWYSGLFATLPRGAGGGPFSVADRPAADAAGRGRLWQPKTARLAITIALEHFAMCALESSPIPSTCAAVTKAGPDMRRWQAVEETEREAVAHNAGSTGRPAGAGGSAGE